MLGACQSPVGVGVDLNAKGSKAAADSLDGAYDTEATIELGKILVAQKKVQNLVVSI